MAIASVTIHVTPEMIAAYLWERDHLICRGTEDYDRVLDIGQGEVEAGPHPAVSPVARPAALDG